MNVVLLCDNLTEAATAATPLWGQLQEVFAVPSCVRFRSTLMCNNR